MINIYIGENGTGKSTLLSELARERIAEGRSVIAIATSFYDKFPNRTKNKPYYYMGARLGRNIAVKAIKEAFSNINGKGRTDVTFMSSVFNILHYASYDKKIGFEIKGFVDQFEDKLDLIKNVGDYGEYEELSYILYRTRKFISNKGEGILWVDKYTSFHDELSGEFLISLLSCEKRLRFHKLISSINVFVQKKDSSEPLPLSDASSGELSLISTSIFIASKVDETTSVFIDEPENSLHPAWQKEYVKKLLDLFPYYELDVHIATHSPIITNGSIGEKNVFIKKFNGSYFESKLDRSGNIEESLLDQFGVLTPKNHILSERCIDIINDVINNKIDKNKGISLVNEYLEYSYESQQKKFLGGIIKLISDL